MSTEFIPVANSLLLILSLLDANQKSIALTENARISLIKKLRHDDPISAGGGVGVDGRILVLWVADGSGKRRNSCESHYTQSWTYDVMTTPTTWTLGASGPHSAIDYSLRICVERPYERGPNSYVASA